MLLQVRRVEVITLIAVLMQLVISEVCKPQKAAVSIMNLAAHPSQQCSIEEAFLTGTCLNSSFGLMSWHRDWLTGAGFR